MQTGNKLQYFCGKPEEDFFFYQTSHSVCLIRHGFLLFCWSKSYMKKTYQSLIVAWRRSCLPPPFNSAITGYVTGTHSTPVPKKSCGGIAAGDIKDRFCSHFPLSVDKIWCLHLSQANVWKKVPQGILLCSCALPQHCPVKGSILVWNSLWSVSCLFSYYVKNLFGVRNALSENRGRTACSPVWRAVLSLIPVSLPDTGWSCCVLSLLAAVCQSACNSFPVWGKKVKVGK